MADVQISFDPPFEYFDWSADANWTVDQNWTWRTPTNWALQPNEDLPIEEGLSNHPLKPVENSFGVVDDYVKCPLKHHIEPIVFEETLDHVAIFFRWYDETFQTQELLANWPYLPKEDSFGITDFVAKKSAIVKSLTINFVEETLDHVAIFFRWYDETFQTQELLANWPYLPKEDSFGITDFVAKKSAIVKSLTINFVEEHENKVVFDRKFEDGIIFNSLTINDVDAQYAELLKIYDAILEPGSGVVSELLFEEGTWDLESVEKYMMRGKPVGHEYFKQFIYGDYTYERALFRVSLDTSETDRALLEQFQIAVDVPDLVDRGSAEVEDRNVDLVVKFYKDFHIAPEVTVTMRAGDSATPVVAEITNITEESFTVHLLNALTGERTTGRFIWTAVGY